MGYTVKNPYLSDFMKFLGNKIRDLVQADRDRSKQAGLPPEVQNEHIAFSRQGLSSSGTAAASKFLPKLLPSLRSALGTSAFEISIRDMNDFHFEKSSQKTLKLKDLPVEKSNMKILSPHY